MNVEQFLERLAGADAPAAWKKTIKTQWLGGDQAGAESALDSLDRIRREDAERAAADAQAKAQALQEEREAALALAKAKKEAFEALATLKFGGPWRKGITYPPGVVVIRGDTTWLSTAETQSPPGAEGWIKLSKPGERGPRGPSGLNGSGGPPGPGFTDRAFQ